MNTPAHLGVHDREHRGGLSRKHAKAPGRLTRSFIQMGPAQYHLPRREAMAMGDSVHRISCILLDQLVYLAPAAGNVGGLSS